MSDKPTELGAQPQQAIERRELSRMAGKLVAPIDYLDNLYRVRASEIGSANCHGLRQNVHHLRAVRDRLVELVATLPEGPLEAFAREHPLYYDQLDGAYCGYGHKNGKPYTCPVHDLALHWDAWELMGTSYTRPERAKR
mgnify:CR=1 FL=1